MKRKSRVLCAILALLLLCACAPKAERVSDEELKALRKHYPYNDVTDGAVDGTTPIEAYPDFETWIHREEPFVIHAVVILKPVGEGYVLDSLVDVNACDAKIREVLWTKGNLKAGDQVTLGLGASIAHSQTALEQVYAEGETLVCILFEPRTDYGVSNFFLTAKEYTLYLTKEDVVLSVSSAGGPDSVSGMYLDAFKSLMNETLGEGK